MTADPRPILWHVPLSRSMRVLWLANEMGLALDVRTLDLTSKAMREGEYADIHPGGRVPALQIDGVTLHESGAIVEYLCETRGRDLWRAPGSPGRPGWLDWLHYAESLGQHLANLTQSHIMLRDPLTRSPTVMRLEAARLRRMLGIAARALDGQDWLMEDGFSGVDCAVGWSVLTAGRFVPLDPPLAAYLNRCRARPAFQAALPDAGTPVIYAQDFYELPDA